MMFVFFFFAINVYGNTRCSKERYPRPNRRNIHPISDQYGKLYTLLQTRNARKWYPLGRHIPIWLIYGSTPPPPPRACLCRLSYPDLPRNILRLFLACVLTSEEWSVRLRRIVVSASSVSTSNSPRVLTAADRMALELLDVPLISRSWSDSLWLLANPRYLNKNIFQLIHWSQLLPFNPSNCQPSISYMII